MVPSIKAYRYFRHLCSYTMQSFYEILKKKEKKHEEDTCHYDRR